MSELFATNAPDRHHWTLNSCSVAFHKVWVHLGSFPYCTKLGAKWAELVPLMQKFMPRSLVGTIHYKRMRNSMQTGQSGAINAKDRATNSRRIFSLQKPPIHTMGYKTHVLLHFVMFECIWGRFVTELNSVQMGQSGTINAKVRVTMSRLNLSLRTCPIHTI